METTMQVQVQVQPSITTPRLPTRPPAIPHLIRTATSLDRLKQLHAQLIKLKDPYLTQLHLTSPPFLSRLLSLSLSPVISSNSLHLHYCLSFFLSSPDPSRLLTSALRSVDPHIAILAYSHFRCSSSSVPLDEFSLSVVLRAIGKHNSDAAHFDNYNYALLREAHGFGIKMGFDLDPFVQTALVSSYASVGRVTDARQVFNRMLYRDLVAWSVMMDSYCRTGNYNHTIRLFEEMKISALTPDRFVLSIVLTACTRTRNLSMGQALHSYIIGSDLSLDTHLQNSLIIMYSSCGHMKMAETIYNNFRSPNMVAATSMIFGYAKLGKIETAHRIFDDMPQKDLISWSALISGYAESDRPHKAFDLFKQMQSRRVRPDEVTMLSLISACSNLGALHPAKQVHIYVKNHGLDRILSVSNALIDMFAKCGSLDDAWKVFEKIPRKNIITWTSMITGFAMHGDGKSALFLFDRMKDENRIKPNHITFVSLLYACSHAGLVKEGQSLFESMVTDYNIEPQQEHYGCMVDLYGRSKLLKEAVELIKTMPFQPNVVVWGSLLGACRIHGDVKLGELAAKRVLELDPNHDGAYVLLSNIYAKAGLSDDVRKIRENMKSRGLSKEKGYSWLELHGTVHAFLTRDNSHPRRTEIYEKLKEVVADVETMGYLPDAGCALIDLDEEEKKEAVLFHSEKLALTFGLINSKRGECVRVSKNIRICEDCHLFVKLVSRVYEREIVLRDRTRFHHFHDGICSCGDFW